jgi:hypothetical protein
MGVHGAMTMADSQTWFHGSSTCHSMITLMHTTGETDYITQSRDREHPSHEYSLVKTCQSFNEKAKALFDFLNNELISELDY